MKSAHPRRNKSAALAAAAAGAVVVLAAAAPTAARAEDRALCIGVNKYPKLRPGADLSGCVPDARLMADKLKLYGYANPRLLTDEQATRAGILAAIAELGKGLTKKDRVVIYFAGHGTRSSNGKSTILPHDARDDKEDNDIGCDKFYEAVKALPAGQKTILLDSCHSGGMVRSEEALTKGWKNRRPRVYIRSARLNASRSVASRGGNGWQEEDINGADDLKPVLQPGKAADKPAAKPAATTATTATTAAAPTAPVATPAATPATAAAPAPEVIYYTAALKTQTAAETEIDGQSHGVFTWYLSKQLDGSGNVNWHNIAGKVAANVNQETEGEQRPLFYPPTADKTPVLGTAPAAESPVIPVGDPKPTPEPIKIATTAPPKKITLSELYNLSQPDPTRVRLARYPETTPVRIKSPNYFQITVGQAGYLVVVNKDPNNDMEVVWPARLEIDAAAVKPGKAIRVPESGMVGPTIDGTDGLKAILFTSRDAATKFLSTFKDADGKGISMPASKAGPAFEEVEVEDAPFYTSELITLVVP